MDRGIQQTTTTTNKYDLTYFCLFQIIPVNTLSGKTDFKLMINIKQGLENNCESKLSLLLTPRH